MSNPLVILLVAIVSCALLTALITVALSRVLSSRKSVALTGGLALPSIAVIYAIYDLGNMAVDDPPPGMLLVGSLMIIGLLVVITVPTAALVTIKLGNGSVG